MVKRFSTEARVVDVPIGVVSKNDNGDRRMPFKAALNIRRLATKPPTLWHGGKSQYRDQAFVGGTHRNARLIRKAKMASPRPIESSVWTLEQKKRLEDIPKHAYTAMYFPVSKWSILLAVQNPSQRLVPTVK